MKFPFPLLALATAATFCALRFAHPRNSFLAAQSPAAASIDTPMQRQIVAKEREGLDALKADDLELFANLTADDAIFLDSQGPATKAQVVKNVVNFKLVDYAMDNLQFVPLSATSGLIFYKIAESGSSHGHDFTAKAYVSSIWAQRDGKWLCIFSQETVAH